MKLKYHYKKIILVTTLFAVIFLSHFFIDRDIFFKQGYAQAPKGRTGQQPFFYPAPRQGPSEIFRKEDITYPFTFIVYGDSREPAGYEKDAIIAKIIREKPSFVIHTGDLVHYGEEHQWQIFDLFDGKIIDNGIPMYPVLGNHEYHTREKSYPRQPENQLQCYFKRFPHLKKNRWYSFVYGNSLFLMLDTTTDYSKKSHQYKWLVDKLKKESPNFLFIAFHYPPYTKAGYEKSSRKAERFLANLLESYKDKGLAKTDIVFSGHAHNYERYKYNDINYVVSGGGGAPQHAVNRDKDDLYNKPGKTYHYCKITVYQNKLTYEMIRLDEKLGTWKTDDTFTISK